jgi:hypothetical protein
VGSPRTKCSCCGSTNLRLSHFRLYDLIWLAMAKLPVRCRYCRERLHWNLVAALQLKREKRAASEMLRERARRRAPEPAQALHVLVAQEQAE